MLSDLRLVLLNHVLQLLVLVALPPLSEVELVIDLPPQLGEHLLDGINQLGDVLLRCFLHACHLAFTQLLHVIQHL